MADIVNLNQYRKKKAQENRKSESGQNRVKSGQPKWRRASERQARDREQAEIDAKKLERGEDD